MPIKEILKITGLAKTYHNVEAVKGIDLSVGVGEIVGLLGPNGAGKTTTINMILGILEPSGGTIKMLGEDLLENRNRLAGQMNFSAVYAQLPPNLTVWQNLYVFGLLYNVPDLRNRIEEMLTEYDLHKYRKTKAGKLSSGEMSRVHLAKALINKPKLLLLDEPTASLDPSVAVLVRQQIRDYAKKAGAGVLWTSHNMNEITAICDRVLFLSHGQILLEGDPKVLPAEYHKADLEDLFISVAREPLSYQEVNKLSPN